MNVERRWKLRCFSTSGLILLGVVFTSMTLGTNMWLAQSLPSIESPSWKSQQDMSLIHDTSYLEDSDYTQNNILHIVTSRFMQLQPNLGNLGRARLRLFETFCLPSMTNQSIQNFIWFIMVDPQLDTYLLERMKELLLPHPNFYLVLMNSKLVTPQNLTAMVGRKQFASGDEHQLLSLMHDTNRPLLLETRLDADDALSGKTLEKLQERARELPHDKNGWQVICNDIHYEWRNDEILRDNTTIETSGQLRLVMESLCITAGYTLVRHRLPGSIEFPSWPNIGHHLMHRTWPKCMGTSNITTDCWTRLPRFPAALRSRTVTSAGMSRVEASESDRMYDNQTETLWHFVERDFGIDRENAKEISQYLQDNLYGIISDNLKGQCTFGHSCKNSSQKKLTSLLEKTNR